MDSLDHEQIGQKLRGSGSIAALVRLRHWSSHDVTTTAGPLRAPLGEPFRGSPLEEEPIAFDSRRAYCNANASPSSSNSIVPFLLDFSTSTAVVPEAGAVAVAVTVAWPPRGMSRCMVP